MKYGTAAETGFIYPESSQKLNVKVIIDEGLN